MPTRIAVLGSNGMTGKALQRLSDTRSKEDERWCFCTRKEVDLRDEPRLRRWLQENGITHVINVAAIVGGLMFNISHPLSTLDENLRLATSVLGACHAAGVQHMVSVLSTCIFPVKHQSAFSEEHLFDGVPHETNAGYAYAKRILFALSKAYALQHGRNYTCVVPPNLYGPHDKFDEEKAHVVGALIRKFALAERSDVKKVNVYGTGVARRQFMFCDDLAFLLVWALYHYKDTASPLIVGPDDDLLIKDLVATIAANFDSDIEVEWDASKPDGQIQKKAINLKMRGLLPLGTWTPTSIEEGIRKTVEWYRHSSHEITRFPLCKNNLPSSDIECAVELLRSGNQLSMGPQTKAFEAEYAEYMGVPEALFVNSGSSANLLAVVAAMHPDRKGTARLSSGDKVAVPALCWSTTVAPLITQGLVPVFVDVNPDTLQMSLDHFESLVKTGDIRGLMLVHVLGSCPDMDRLMSIVDTHSIVFIEDSCEAMGNTWKGKRLGTFGDFGTFSTFYSHHMTSIEGGFVLARTDEDRLRLRGMRAHGWIRHLPAETQDEYKASYPDIDPRFLFVDIGFNMRPLDLCAVIGRQQLKRLSDSNYYRQNNYSRIQGLLHGKKGVHIPSSPEGSQVAFLAIPIILPPGVNTQAIQAELEKRGVETRPIISGNFLRQPMMKRWDISYEDPSAYPGAEKVHHQGIYIGLHGERWSDLYCEVLSQHILSLLK